MKNVGSVDLSSCEDVYQGIASQRTQSLCWSCDEPAPFSIVVDMLATDDSERELASSSRAATTIAGMGGSG
jgi:hypothetical protein